MSFAGALQVIMSSLLRSVEDFLHLDTNAVALWSLMEDLLLKRRDVESMVVASGRRTQRVTAWIDSVDSLARRADDLRLEIDRSGTGCLSCWSSWALGRTTAESLARVKELNEQMGVLGVFVGMALSEDPEDDLGVPVAGSLPDSLPIIGRGRTLASIRDYLRSDDVCVIGIYGMGGVGKTTLLKQINNELLAAGRTCMFDAIIWVDVAENPVQKIQDSIRAQLGLRHQTNWEMCDPEIVKQGANILSQALGRRKFLLLLDDLWERFDLLTIGIPHPSTQRDSKIVFTSRSRSVCRDMHADVNVSLSPLDAEESWMLFRRSVGSEVDLMSPPIPPIALRIVHFCGGLPLALVLVGRSLANTLAAGEWEHALSQLKESSGMDNLLSTLKLSYDRLEDEACRQCFLYCSLFPEKNGISIEQLIDHWVAEGLLDNEMFPDHIDEARNRGRFIIERLKAATLLHSGSGEDGDMYVMMHDLIREMALSINHMDRKSLLLQVTEFQGSYLYHDVLRISLVGDEIGDFSGFPECPNLLTLLFNKSTSVKCIPNNLFNLMPVLRVLDLSGTRIENLPDQIGLLPELRYLNLSDTLIRSLPIHIGKLLKLEQLDLGHTRELVKIPQQAIISLTRLWKLNLYNSAYCWESESEDYREIGLFSLKDLKCLQSLNDLRLDVKLVPILVEILSSSRLSRSIRYLTMENVEKMTHLPPNFDTLKKLRKLCIDECPDLQELAFTRGQLYKLEALSLFHLSITKMVIGETALYSLRHLRVYGCHTVKDLTSIHQLPRLQDIDIRVCSGLELLISAQLDDSSTIFPQLRKINLYALPKFKGIYRHPLLLPCLEHLEVYGCPMFMKLPLDSHSARNIKQILGMQKWWDALHWDEERTKLWFLHYFKNPWQEEEEEEQEEEEDMSKRRGQFGDGEGSGVASC